MTEQRANKFQWISIVYLLLFVLAVFSPSLIQSGYFGIHEQHIEETLIFLFGIAGISIFMLYERLMEKKEKEHEAVVDACERAKRELVSSYQYIGSLNRQMDVLKKISNDTSISMYDQHQLSKDLLKSLTIAASGSMGGAPALLRFVHIDKLRTEHEYFHTNNKAQNQAMNVPNKELKRVHEQKLTYDVVGSNGKRWIAIPSDQLTDKIKAFMVIEDNSDSIEGFDPSIIKVFVNQAELINRALRNQDLENGSPSELIEQATREVNGTVN